MQIIVLNESVPDCVVQQVATNVFWCDNIVNVVVPGPYDTTSNDVVTGAIQTYFQHFADVDFMAVNLWNQSISDNIPRAVWVKSKVAGLGLTESDRSVFYGSDGDFTAFTWVRPMSVVLVHEFLHTWLHFNALPPGMRDPDVPIHIDAVTFKGPMATKGFLEELSNGNFRLSTDHNNFIEPLSSFELHAAGAIPASAVEEWRVINPDVRNQYGHGDEVPIEDTILYDMTDFTAVNGPIENFDGSPRQTTFRVGFLVVSTEPLSVTDMTFLSLRNQYIVGNSDGLGMVQTGIFELPDPRSLNSAFGPLIFQGGVELK